MMLKKTIFLFFVSFLCSSAFSQCELTILDTNHVKCFGDNTGGFNLQSSASQPFQVFLSNGLVQNNDLNFSNLFASTYSVVIVDDLGCTDTIDVKIKQPSKLDVVLACENGQIVANPSGGVADYDYSWKSDQGVQVSQENSVAFVPNYLFDFTLTDQNQCVFTDTVFVFADFVLDSLLGQLPFDVVVNNLSSNGQYYWDFGGVFSSTSKNPFYTFESVGEYKIELIVSDQFGCEDVKQVDIDVQGFDYELNDWADFPNAFSPNEDGANDYITFEDSHALAVFNVTIFNRWGKPLLKWDDPNFKWYGKTENGNKLTEGVYFYHLKASGQNGKMYEKMGALTMFE
jgi:gliding motility-associated-like protein